MPHWLDLAVLTLHHRIYSPRYLRPSVPNRTAQTTDISIGHRCCLMPEQIPQDVRSNARCCCLGHNRTPQIVQFHTFNSSVCDNLYEMLPHGVIDGAHFAVVGKNPLASVEARKLYQKVQSGFGKVVDPSTRFRIRQHQTACFNVDVFPLDTQNFPDPQTRERC